MITDYQAKYNAYELCHQSNTMQELHDFQAGIAKLEKQKRDKLIEALSQRLKQKTQVEELFTIHWN